MKQPVRRKPAWGILRGRRLLIPTVCTLLGLTGGTSAHAIGLGSPTLPQRPTPPPGRTPAAPTLDELRDHCNEVPGECKFVFATPGQPFLAQSVIPAQAKIANCGATTVDQSTSWSETFSASVANTNSKSKTSGGELGLAKILSASLSASSTDEHSTTNTQGSSHTESGTQTLHVGPGCAAGILLTPKLIPWPGRWVSDFHEPFHGGTHWERDDVVNVPAQDGPPPVVFAMDISDKCKQQQVPSDLEQQLTPQILAVAKERSLARDDGTPPAQSDRCQALLAPGGSANANVDSGKPNTGSDDSVSSDDTQDDDGSQSADAPSDDQGDDQGSDDADD